MGRIIDGFQARVVDADDVELPSGEAGELVLRADEPFAFASGYFGMAEKTVEACGTSGSIPATGSSVTTAVIFASSTGSRTRSAAAAKTFLPMRSSRAADASDIDMAAVFPPARNWPRMK